MNGLFAREFRLSPAGSGHGLSCSETGAFIGPVPLLKWTAQDGIESWEPRNSEELSHELSEQYGLPVDMSSKIQGLHAVAHALNAGETARAQIVALFLQIPEPLDLIKTAWVSEDAIALILALHESRLLAKEWNPCLHPRWPAGAPDCQGGKFAPKNAETQSNLADHQPRGGEVTANSRRPTFPWEGEKPITGNPIPVIPELAIPEIEAEAEVGLTELEARLEAELSARFGLRPGPYAKESIPASGPKITRSEQETINGIGSRDGCHTCGTRTPGTKDGHWIGDHQPPTRLNLSGRPSRLYSQCLKCSNVQGGTVTQVLRRLFGLRKLMKLLRKIQFMPTFERSVAAPNSLLFIDDPTHDYAIPDNTGGPLTFTSSCITVGTLESSRSDETTVRLGSDLGTPSGQLIFDGTIETPGRYLEVGNSWLERIFLMPVNNIVTHVRIWTNHPTEPDQIWIEAR